MNQLPSSVKDTEVPPGSLELCEICSKIDFDEYFKTAKDSCVDEQYLPAATPTALRLGCLKDICQKGETCAFCWLVVRAVCTMQISRESTPALLWEKERTSTELTECWMYSYCSAQNERLDANDRLSKAFRIGIAARPGSNSPDHSVEDQIGDIQLLADDARRKFGSYPFYGRRINHRLDVDLLRYWLSVCEQEHANRCQRLPVKIMHQPQEVLVIDVRQKCLCKLPDNARYVAISYCWPPSGAFKTLTSNLSDLLKPNSLERGRVLLPKVIEDSIELVDALGETYIWVDALCIVQDDDDHKERQINQMAAVYGCAVVTIVPVPNTMDPQKACEGLPRFNPNLPRREQKIACVTNLNLTVPFEAVLGMVSRSRWDTRAWTYQECLLSRRILFFTSSQVYFQCRCSVFCEDCVGEIDTSRTFISPCTNLWNPGAPEAYSAASHAFGSLHLDVEPYSTPSRSLIAYRTCVETYSARQLTFISDALKAFVGVQDALQYLMNTKFIFGMPEKFLDIALLFTIRGRKLRTTKHQLRNCSVPSWSWIGWNCAVMLGMYFPSALSMVRREVDWYALGPRGDIARLKSDVAEWPRPDVDRERQILPGTIPNLPSSASNASLGVGSYQAKHMACWTGMTELRLDGSFTHETSASFKLWPTAKHLRISNNQGHWVGSILTEQAWVQSTLKQMQGFQFILISRTKEIELSPEQHLDVFDCDRFAPRPWCFLNVMLVDIVGGLSQRQGIGVVHEDAWSIAMPKWTVVVLE